jgi:hypothetical protein
VILRDLACVQNDLHANVATQKSDRDWTAMNQPSGSTSRRIAEDTILGFLVATVLHSIFLSDLLAAEPPIVPISPPAATEEPGDVAITLEASRSQLSAGSGFALKGYIKNKTDKAIALSSSMATMTLPPELLGSNVYSFAANAFFPTETSSKDDQNVWNRTIILAAKDTYPVIWSWDEIESDRYDSIQRLNIPEFAKMVVYTVASELQFLLLTPGDYKVGVAIRYHVDGDPPEVYKTAIQSALVHVSAPEFVILIGAALGGLLGYIISRIYLSNESPLKGRFAFLQVLVGMLGSMLLSAIVTILLARISETQFLVRVSINDLWGAIAIGFIASIIGIRILDNFIPPSKSAQSKGTVPQAESTGAQSESTPTQADANYAGRPSFKQTQLRAYLIGERRRLLGTHGNETSDWAQAEKELQDELTSKPPPPRRGTSWVKGFLKKTPSDPA